MTRFLCLFLLMCSTPAVLAQGNGIKALVGGTLIDGYGGEPLNNSVIIAVKGDVLRYIALLQDVDVVIRHGKRYK